MPSFFPKTKSPTARKRDPAEFLKAGVTAQKCAQSHLALTAQTPKKGGDLVKNKGFLKVFDNTCTCVSGAWNDSLKSRNGNSKGPKVKHHFIGNVFLSIRWPNNNRIMKCESRCSGVLIIVTAGSWQEFGGRGTTQWVPCIQAPVVVAEVCMCVCVCICVCVCAGVQVSPRQQSELHPAGTMCWIGSLYISLPFGH